MPNKRYELIHCMYYGRILVCQGERELESFDLYHFLSTLTITISQKMTKFGHLSFVKNALLAVRIAQYAKRRI